MSSRERILKNVRQNQPAPVELPATNGPWQTFEDPRAQFTQTLEGIGGRVVPIRQLAEVRPYLEQQQLWHPDRVICSLVAEVGPVTGMGPAMLDLADVADPHELAQVDLAIMAGEFAVAENGAIWLTDAGLKHRALPFITQHLVLLLSASQIVHTMHQAYERLSFTEARFGVFISGPSKTADIEQSLVLGAHGARSLTVFLVED